MSQAQQHQHPQNQMANQPSELQQLKVKAKELQTKADGFDSEIKSITANKAATTKELRSIMGKIITLELKEQQ